jgi:eukaryotic-like serine/threonine-protein kinase
VATMYEHGVADGVVYYVVAHPEGSSLRDRLSRERQLPLGDALDVADGVAAALAHAHARDVRHGDLRPKHVFAAAGGGAGGGAACVVTGLGVAESLLRATSHERTSTSIRIGSPAYQSPEQVTGSNEFDARSDIYSLGCILFEMLAGEVPFASANPTHLVMAKFTAPVPSVRERRDSVSAELDAVVRRCLAKSPSDRFRDADELRAALGAARAVR